MKLMRPSDRRSFLTGLGAVGTAALALRGRPLSAAEGDLSYWHHFTSQSEFAGLERIMALFQERYPGVTVSQETIPNAEFMAKFTAAVVAGSPADTTMVSAERFPDMVAMGGVVDITDRIDAWPLKDSFGDAAFQSVTKDGRVYGVPAFSFVNWVYYRKDWFDELGIAPPDTMEAFLDACLKVTDAGQNRYGFGMRAGDGGHGFIIDMMRAWGSPLVEDGKVALDKPKMMEAIQFYSDLFTVHKVAPPSAPNDSYRQIMEGFKTGQTAMVWHHTGSYVEISGALPSESFDTTIRPAGPAARIAEVSFLYNGLMSDGQADAAWDWVSFWGESDPAIVMLEETGYFPASQQAATDPRITANPKYQAASETLTFGVLPPNFAGAAAWGRNIVLPEFQKILVGSSNVEDAVDNMIKGLEKELG